MGPVARWKREHRQRGCETSALPTCLLALPTSLFGSIRFDEPSNGPSHVCILCILPGA